ncbi:MAG: VWA domain-containing protein [Phycisphaerae bacterium]|nr:VWA domain-containing protein [Phycisphaerae bacterium]
MTFTWPWMLWLLALVPLLGWRMRRTRGTASVRFPGLAGVRSCPVSWRIRLRPMLQVARLACIALLIVALARPRKGTVLSEASREGIAIEAVVDRSGSMRTEMGYEGQKLTRLEVVKQVLSAFIKGDGRRFEGRAGDLIGLVTFARYADTVCPLVHSHDALLEFLRQTRNVEVQSEDGTAIGDGLALAAARLRKAEEEIARRRVHLGLAGGDPNASPLADFQIKGKAIILLTDGQLNAGEYHPLTAADLAKQWGIKVYTIGIGSDQAFGAIQTPFGTMRVPARSDLDEGLLRAVAERTGGFYSRADDAEALVQIVRRINDLEKTPVRTQVIQYAECFAWWTWPALAILVAEILASCTVFRKIP